MNWLTRVSPAPGALRAVVLAATLSQPALAATETRSVADFDEVVFAVAGEVSIEQGPRETLTLEAEPAVRGPYGRSQGY